jgi:hypothetical protein
MADEAVDEILARLRAHREPRPVAEAHRESDNVAHLPRPDGLEHTSRPLQPI